jgi:hypothetical protein
LSFSFLWFRQKSPSHSSAESERRLGMMAGINQDEARATPQRFLQTGHYKPAEVL